jgi:hypothetical protein
LLPKRHHTTPILHVRHQRRQPFVQLSLANVSGWSSAWTLRRAERCRPFEAKARATRQIASAVRASRQRGPSMVGEITKRARVT